jgi:ribose 5-phosphate isomerase RpiB
MGCDAHRGRKQGTVQKTGCKPRNEAACLEDDDLNLIRQGSRVLNPAWAWEMVETVFSARFSGAASQRRRLAKVAELESKEA